MLATGVPGRGGEIKFRAVGGAINVGGKVRADRGTIDVQNTGRNGAVNLNGATLSADVVKVGALGENGTLTINGGTISADTLLKLYANSSNGTVLFSGNVSLNGDSTKIISGNTVTINPNITVFIGGGSPAQVYTNDPNYTGSGGVGNGFGQFGGAGAQTHKGEKPPGH